MRAKRKSPSIKLETPEEKELLLQVNPQNLPQHIAIIMDGNGRWAALKRLPRIEGHRRGIQSVREIVTLSRELGIKALTLYAFSNENWNRPLSEISPLMMLLEKYLQKELKTMMEGGIRFRTIGQIDRLPDQVTRLIQRVEEKTKGNKEMTLILALSYGGRSEVVDAIKRVIEDIKTDKLSIKDLDEERFSNYLYTRDFPDPDLMIRTGGEIRTSNFLPWQLVYTELYFTQTFWPDFGKRELLSSILAYQKRNRRFGLIPEESDLPVPLDDTRVDDIDAISRLKKDRA